MEIDPTAPSTSETHPSLGRGTRFLLSTVDVLPFFGAVKMLIEAVRGQTMDGFKLNPLERGCYSSAATFHLASFVVAGAVVRDLLQREDLLEMVQQNNYQALVDETLAPYASAVVLCQMGYYGSFGLGKLRNMVDILPSVPLQNEVSDLVDDICRKLYVAYLDRVDQR